MSEDHSTDLTRAIPLTGKYAKGRFVLVDADDYERLSKSSWWCDPHGYASATLKVDGERRHFRLARVVLGIEHRPELHADHINRNRLDNRKANLRAVPSRINRQNTSGQTGTSSRFRGVYHQSAKKNRPWRARIMLDGKKQGLGYYDTELEAALAIEVFRATNMPWALPDPALPIAVREMSPLVDE